MVGAARDQFKIIAWRPRGTAIQEVDERDLCANSKSLQYYCRGLVIATGVVCGN